MSEEDVLMAIHEIKTEMEKLYELQRKLIEEEKREESEKRKEILDKRIWEIEGEILGLHHACKVVRNRFIESMPYLEKETCEVIKEGKV